MPERHSTSEKIPGVPSSLEIYPKSSGYQCRHGTDRSNPNIRPPLRGLLAPDYGGILRWTFDKMAATCQLATPPVPISGGYLYVDNSCVIGGGLPISDN